MKWLPSAVVAGSVLLKQRNQEMNATASVLGVLLKTGSIEVFRRRISYVIKLNSCQRVGRQSVDSRPTVDRLSADALADALADASVGSDS